jgi:copper chaperone CopZ
MTTKTYNVPDIHCGGCAASIEGAVGGLTGVETVQVAIAERTVDVTFDEGAVGEEAIVGAIEGQGYVVAR